ncbi:class I SAM-dependent methyltransferase [Kribbella sp. NPDC056861]|uniref:class I SAM-dependent methyltransferase n=1 Tax=Kribbella sp. NPDC056861 TaxID=3154857 RepID=UPI00342D5EB8
MSTPAAERLLDEISLAAIANTVALGGESLDVEELIRALRVAPRHQRLFRRWVTKLTGDATARPVIAGGRPDLTLLDGCYAELGFPARMARVHRAMLERLPELLRDELDIRQILFADGDVRAALAAYQSNRATRQLNAACAQRVAELSRRQGGRLRILEIGGGSGGTSRRVLAELGSAEFDYLFTDLSRFFTAAAERELGVRTALLDIDGDLPAAGSADVIIAGHVLHNAIDLGRTLRGLRAVLVEGGELLFTEAVQERASVLTSMEFLLSPERGRPAAGSADARAVSGRMFPDVESWMTELRAAGFAVGPDTVVAQAGLGQSLFRAVRPTGPSEAITAALVGTQGPYLVLAADASVERELRSAGEVLLPVPVGERPATVLAHLERTGARTLVLTADQAGALATAPTAALTNLSSLASMIVVGPTAASGGPTIPGASPQIVAVDNELRRGAELAGLLPAAQRIAAGRLSGEFFERGADLSGRLRSLCLRAMLTTFQQAGCLAHSQTRHDVEELIAALDPVARYEPLIRRWIDCLVGEELVASDGANYRLAGIASKAVGGFEACRVEWNELFGSAHAIDYAERSIRLLPALVRGTADPIALLFPDGRMDVANGIYREGVVQRFQREVVIALISLLVERPGQLRVLEVGAGTGATTEAVLAGAGGRRIDYWFTDISRPFLDQARATFGAEVARYAVYDLDRPALSQGIEPASFDLVIAGGALNAVEDTDAAVRGLVECLVPGGGLLLTEPTVEEPWVLVTQALLMNPPRDDRKSAGSTFLDLGQWHQVLDRAGLDRGPVVPPAGHPLERLGHHVLTGQVPRHDKENH